MAGNDTKEVSESPRYFDFIVKIFFYPSKWRTQNRLLKKESSNQWRRYGYFLTWIGKILPNKYRTSTSTVPVSTSNQFCGSASRIRTRIHRIHKFFSLLDPDPDPLVRGMDLDPAFFVGVLKVNDENSRIRIRIHYSEAWIRGPGSTPKCHGSATLPATLPKAGRVWFW